MLVVDGVASVSDVWTEFKIAERLTAGEPFPFATISWLYPIDEDVLQMTEEFDPYHKWLGIPKSEQPANYYRLLGVNSFESDSEVIETAADQRMSHLRTFQNGKRAALSQKLLGEVSRARICLLDDTKRAAYDEELSQNTVPSLPPVPKANVSAPPLMPPPVEEKVQPTGPPAQSEPDAPLRVSRAKSAAAYRRKPVSPLLVLGLLSLAIVGAAGVLVVVVMFVMGDGDETRPGEGTLQVAGNDSGTDEVPTRRSADEHETDDPSENRRGPRGRSNGRGGTDGRNGGSPNSPDDQNGDDNSNGRTDPNGMGTGNVPSVGGQNGTPRGDDTDVDAEGSNQTRIGNRPRGGFAGPDPASGDTSDSGSNGIGARGMLNTRSPAPSSDELAPYLEEISSTFALDDETSEQEERIELARDMVDAATASQSNDEIEQYALLVAAMDVASKSGGARVFREGFLALADRFELQGRQLLADGIADLSGTVSATKEFQSLMALIELYVRESTLELDIESAEMISTWLRDTSRPLKRVYQKQIAALEGDLASIRAELIETKNAKGDIDRGDFDQFKHERVGGWLCFQSQDWENGLEYLSGGPSERDSKKLADLELQVSEQPGNMVELADSWLQAAEGAGDLSDGYLHRAGYWYLKALASTTSITERERIRLSLEEIYSAGVLPGVTVPLSHCSYRFVSGIELVPLEALPGQMRDCESVAYSPDGGSFAFQADGNDIMLHDALDFHERLQFSAPRGRWLALTFSHDGSLLAAGSLSSAVCVWNSGDAEMIHQFDSAQRGITSIAFRADDRSLIASETGRRVNAWSIERNSVATYLELHQATVNDIAVTSKGNTLVTASDDTNVAVWNAGRNRYWLTGHQARVETVAVSPDDDMIVSGDDSGRIIVWNMATGDSMMELSHSSSIIDVEFFPFSSLFASIDRDRNLKVWRSFGGGLLFETRIENVNPKGIAISPRGDQLIVHGTNRSIEGALQLFRIEYN